MYHTHPKQQQQKNEGKEETMQYNDPCSLNLYSWLTSLFI